MEQLRKLRLPYRASVTKLANEIDHDLGQKNPERIALEVKVESLNRIQVRMAELDDKILGQLVDDNCTDEEQDAEWASIEEYEKKWMLAKSKFNEFFKVRRSASPTGSASEYRTSTAASSGGSKRNYKLPKVELKKFNGDLDEWLGFWAQFQKIHEDEELHASDKFQYLVQSMTEGTRARKLVESYPQSAGNYQKVIDALTDRFGDKVLLTEVYVRKLLRLVITNVGRGIENKSLSNMYDELESNLRSLETLGVTADQSAAFLYPLVESSLPEEVVKVWQRSPLSGYGDEEEIGTRDRLMALMKFLKQEVKGAERLVYVRAGLGDKSKQKNQSQGTQKGNRSYDDIPTAAGLYAGEKIKCIFCEKAHDTRECVKANGMTLEEKTKVVQTKNCCFACLRSGHRSKTCKSFIKCLACGKRHVTLMCPDLPAHTKTEGKRTSREQTQVVNSNLACSSTVYLKTILVTIVGKHNKRQVRALLDDGCQRSYIQSNVAEDLKLSAVDQVELIHCLFSGVQTTAQKHSMYIIQLQKKGGGLVQVTTLEKTRLCGVIPRLSKGPWIKELKQKNIWLNDMEGGAEEIGLLIGADIIGSLLTGQVFQLQNGLTAVNTVLGWTLMGKLNSNSVVSDSVAMSVSCVSLADSSIQQLWNLETIGIRDPVETQSKEEKEEQAKQHFINNEGIIEEVPKDEIERESHYLPHRAVFKPDSLTTPVRPVFDASCKAKRCPSLNDCLEKGPNLLELIPSILLRFREKKIGIISDIRKAFQMIEINKEDQDFLRFLWWENNTDKIHKTYRHRRVVFGVNCSPFLLAAVIGYHLENTAKSNHLVAEKLLRSLYVDNCVTSEDDIEDCIGFKEKAVKMMSDAAMDLRQWEFGSAELPGIGQLINSRCGLGTNQTQFNHTNSVTNVLGLKWNKESDTLSCDLSSLDHQGKITKRTILSSVQKIFDPIGFSCPVTLQPKLFLQKLWKEKLNWDDEVPTEIQNMFRKWCSEFQCLTNIEIPRNITGCVSDRRSWQIHTFCDACLEAYAAAIFLRTTSQDKVSIQLLQAKSRVAPIKKTTIPRLELLSCTIAARLTDSVTTGLSLKEVPTYYWSDSTTALAWIRRNDEWGTFVGNRVKEICKLTNVNSWRHVPGSLNPADLPSRGCTPAQLTDSSWWEGPKWLSRPYEEWPSQHMTTNESEVSTERKKSSVISLAVSSESPWYLPKSSFSKNVTTMAWIRRFIDQIRRRCLEKGRLAIPEIVMAEKSIIKLVQHETIHMNGNVVSGVRTIKDEEGFVRVETKLLYRDDSLGFRCPILLPNSHLLTEQIIREKHVRGNHAGVQYLMGKIREKYWIIQGRRAIRKIVNKCTVCRRFTAKRTQVVPAPLPRDRVDNAKVFEIVGVDLAGPLYLKNKEKAWIVLYTCAVYRGIHLELVKSLSTDSFLDSFSRFTERRGRPSTVYSDNGTNFTGARNEFQQLDWEKIHKECGMKRIQWKFNPPTAAWWGGWWERLVRSIKDLLRRILGRACLSYEKMLTYLCDIEAVINGRPLTTVTEDPDDLIPLTPAMFMHEVPCATYTDRELLDASGFQKLFKQRTTVLDQFKERFRKEYLAALIQRGKEKTFVKFQIGDVVLVGADNKRRWEWPMGKILELIPGKDGNIRVARVKTVGGTLLRPTQRLYPLEVSSVTDVPEIPIISNDNLIREEEPPEVWTRHGRKVKLPQRFKP